MKVTGAKALFRSRAIISPRTISWLLRRESNMESFRIYAEGVPVLGAKPGPGVVLFVLSLKCPSTTPDAVPNAVRVNLNVSQDGPACCCLRLF